MDGLSEPANLHRNCDSTAVSNGGWPTADCRCRLAIEGDQLVVDATDCSGRGRLAVVSACRATVVGKLTRCDVRAVVTTTPDGERTYTDDAAALLVAAGRFADLVRVYDERLADRTLTDPLRAAREATGRPGGVGRLLGETGLAELAARADGYDEALRSSVADNI